MAAPSYEPPMQPQQHQQQNVVINQASSTQSQTRGWQASHKSGVAALSIIQIVAGSICVVFQIALTVVFHIHSYDEDSMSSIDGYVGTGIWCGGYFILTGSIGMGSRNSNGLCWIVSFLVLNILSCSVLVWTLLGLTATSLGIVNGECGEDYSYYWITNSCEEGLWRTSMGLNSIMLVISVLQFVVTLTSSIFGCMNTCCRPYQGAVGARYPNGANPQGVMVHYTSNNGVQMPVQTAMIYGPQNPSYAVQAVVHSNNPMTHYPQPVGYPQNVASNPPAYTTALQQPNQQKY